MKLHRNLPDGFNAKLYQTTEECSLPDLEQSNDNFGFRPIKEPEEATDELNFGQVRVQDCGLVNLAVVLTNPNAGYVEHLIQPIFVNCSLDFQVDFEGDLGETLIYPGVQPLDGAKMKIELNTGSIRDPDVENFESTRPLLPICNPKVTLNLCSIIVKRFPAQVKSFPAQVKRFPALVKSFPAMVKSLHSLVKSFPALVKSFPPNSKKFSLN